VVRLQATWARNKKINRNPIRLTGLLLRYF
jgi:hypothetical protein